MSALIGVPIAGPGLDYLISGMNRRTVSGRRYATYDPELYLLGNAISPATAQLLALGVAPLLLGLSAFLVYRGIRSRNHRGTPARGESD